MSTVFGNMEIRETGRGAVALRMHNFVEGHEGCWFTYSEIETIAAHLQQLVMNSKRRNQTTIEIASLEAQFDDVLG